MPQPYNPWGTPVFPNTGSAFGVGSPAEAAERQPTFVDHLLSHIAGALGRGFMAPGQALQSTEPITSEQMIKPAQDMLTLAQTAGMPRAAAGNAVGELGMAGGGIKAYHGSPHDFDRFDISKIGTGEGAQAYGHGLYFAENEGVARSYRDALSAAPHGTDGIAARILKTSGGDYEAAINRALAAAGKYTPEQSLNGDYQAAAQLLRDWQATGKGPPGGKMYEVNLNADPAHFLDWDKPLLAQGEKPRQALNEIWGLPSKEAQATMSAEDAYRAMGITFHQPGRGHLDNAAVSSALNEAGIPGIRYLDQGSRAGGQGSSNYVMFDDKLIDILKKYGLAGFAAAPILAGAAGDNPK